LNDLKKGALLLSFLFNTALEYEVIKKCLRRISGETEMNLAHLFLVYADDVSFRVENSVGHNNKGHRVLLAAGKKASLTMNEEKAKCMFRCQNAVQNIKIDKLRKCSKFQQSGQNIKYKLHSLINQTKRK
jgi:hypothetical protein